MIYKDLINELAIEHRILAHLDRYVMLNYFKYIDYISL
jgi:hypothetical protein